MNTSLKDQIKAVHDAAKRVGDDMTIADDDVELVEHLRENRLALEDAVESLKRLQGIVDFIIVINKTRSIWNH